MSSQENLGVSFDPLIELLTSPSPLIPDMLDLLCDPQSLPNPSGPLSSSLSAVGLHHLITKSPPALTIFGSYYISLKVPPKDLVFSNDRLEVET